MNISSTRDVLKWFESEEYFLSRMDDIVYRFSGKPFRGFETLRLNSAFPRRQFAADEILAHKNPHI
jgi:hypothetical protein